MNLLARAAASVMRRLLASLRTMRLAHLDVLGADRRPRSPAARSSDKQLGDDADGAARVEHVDRLPLLVVGAILTAVCTRLVVAPPISSGQSKPSRSISAATKHISSSDGVISPDSPMMSAFSRLRGLEDLRRRHHDAEVDHLVVVALQHDADDVLADVVHVALDRRHHDLAARPAWRRARSAFFSASMNGCR